MNQLVFCSCNTWRGGEAAVTSHFRAHLGEAEWCWVPYLLPFLECLSPSGIGESCGGERGSSLPRNCEAAGRHLLGLRKPCECFRSGIAAMDWERNQQGDPGPSTPGRWCDWCLPFAHPSDFIFPCGRSELCVWNVALTWEMQGEVSLVGWSLRNMTLPLEEQDRHVGGVIWGHMLGEADACFPDPLHVSAVATNDNCVDVHLEWGVRWLEGRLDVSQFTVTHLDSTEVGGKPLVFARQVAPTSHH